MSSSDERKVIEDIKNKKADSSEDLNRGLDLLANGLFTRQGQFLYELIQNAEDCADPDIDTRVEITLTSQGIIIRNNGELFTKEDVRNICGVGRTQKKSEDENIGFWGIGFKSVYRITETPYVISGGFQFKFDRTYWENPETKYSPSDIPWQITPIWVSDPPIDTTSEWNNFYFPYIRDESQDDRYKKRVKESVDQLENHLLLFLERIKEININDETKGGDQSKSMRVENRDRVANGRLVTLADGEEWWIHEDSVEIPEKVQNDKVTRERKRENIENSPVKIALKVEEGSLTNLTEGSVHTSVFSFLPVQGVTSGMPFMIDADLLTGADRTSPNEEAVWNEHMMEQIGETVLPNVIEKLRKHDQWKFCFQKALFPYEQPDSKLFERLDNAISKHAASDIIPTTNDEWVDPTEAIVPVGDYTSKIREVLTSEDIEEVTEFNLAHSDLQLQEGMKELRRRLRVRELGLNEDDIETGATLVEFLTDENWLQTKADNKDEEWFRQFYALLDESDVSDLDLSEEPIVYTSRGLKTPSETYLSFSEIVEDVIKEINIEEAFLTVPESISSDEAAGSFLKAVGLSPVTADDVAEDFIEFEEMLVEKAKENEVASWFKKLYQTLANSSRHDELQNIPIVYTGKQVVSPSDDSTDVLLPAEGERVQEILNDVETSLTDVVTVPEEIISEDNGSQEAKDFLTSLGLDQVTPHLIAKRELLPKITIGGSERVEECSIPDSDVLLTYTGIVNEELKDNSEIENTLVVLTSDGSYSRIDETYLSEEYGSEYDTTTLLSSPTISTRYTENRYGDNWPNFFSDLGVKSETDAKAIETALTLLPNESKNPKQELEKLYPLLTQDVGADIDTEGLRIKTVSDDYKKITDIYVPDSETAIEKFPENRFAWLPEDDPDSAEKLRNLGIASASNNLQITQIMEGEHDDPIDGGVEHRIEQVWDAVQRQVSKLPGESPEIRWINAFKREYRLGEELSPQSPEQIDQYADFDGDTLFLTSDFHNRWADLANTLIEWANSDTDPAQLTELFIPSVEDAAIDVVAQYERSKDRKPRDVRGDRDEHIGYDVYSIDPINEKERYIEIKSFSEKGVASLREAQQKKADNNDNFCLYIVVAPKGDNPQLWIKKSPNTERLLEEGAEYEEVLKVPQDTWDSFTGPISTSHL